jgi:hypothetical protein
MDINEKVIMSLETYNKLFLENTTLNHELEMEKQKPKAVFELEPIYGVDNRMSVTLTAYGQALYEEFASAHPEYNFDSSKSVSFYSVAEKKAVEADA